MNMTPEFSILIPAYNTEEFMSTCLDSVLAQTWKDFEVLAVDDGSTDGTGAILDAYAAKDPRIRVEHKENGGIMQTRVYAIDRARGDYLVFLDSDDTVEPDLLEYLHGVFTEKQCDCAVYGYRRVSAEGRTEVHADESELLITDKRELYRHVLFNSDYNSLWRRAVRRGLFGGKDYSGYFRDFVGEDLLHGLEIWKNCGAVFFSPKVLYNYRMNPVSITHRKLKYTDYKVDFETAEYVLDFLREENVFTPQDYRDYRDVRVNRVLFAQLRKVGRFATTFSEKKRLLRHIRSEKYYREFILTEPVVIRGGRLNRMIWSAFTHGCDGLALLLLRYQEVRKHGK